MNKSERQLNLVFLLLSSKRGVTRRKIRESISDYFDSTSDSSFERMFERDKQEIKDLGFQIEVVQDDFASSEEIVYRIDKSLSLLDFENFSLAERLLLQVARNAISNSGVQHHSTILKLESDSEFIDFGFKLGEVQSNEAVLGPVLQSIKEKRKISFYYQGMDQDSKTNLRIVTPIKLVIRSGDIYLVTYCHDKNDYRTFRLDRILNTPLLKEIDGKVYSLDKVYELEQLLENEQLAGKYLIRLKPGYSLHGAIPKGVVISELAEDTRVEFFSYAREDLIEFIAFNLPSIDSILSNDLLVSLRAHFGMVNHV